MSTSNRVLTSLCHCDNHIVTSCVFVLLAPIFITRRLRRAPCWTLAEHLFSEWEERKRCKFKQARLWNACTGTGVSTGGRGHSPQVCKFVLRMLWICAQWATDRDLESFFVNAWICTCQATDLDLESVFVKRKVNAWICACQATDRDL